MKHFFLFILGLFSLSAFPQDNAMASYSSFFSLNKAKYAPAALGENMKTVQINLLNTYIWTGNTTFHQKLIENIIDEQKSHEERSKIFNRLKETNRIGAGTTIDYFHLGFRINKREKEELFSFSLGVSDRAEAGFVFSNNFLKLLWNGNAPYENQTLPFPNAGTAFYSREYAAGFAFPIYKNEKLSLRLGGKYKYLHGIAGFSAEKIDGSLYTQRHGKSNTLNYDYLINTSYNEESFNPLEKNGSGQAIDFGVSAQYKERFFADLNILDWGKIRFTEHTTSYRNAGSIQYEGMIIDNIMTDNPSINDTILDEIWKNNEYQGESFRLQYPTRLRLHTAYKISRENKKGEKYYIHSLHLTYIQGLVNSGSATQRAYIGTAYTYNIKNHIELGSNLGFRGYNRLMEFGVFAGFRVGFFRIGIGSGNLTPLVLRTGTGVDFNFNLTFSF